MSDNTSNTLSEEALRWNRFTDEICTRPLQQLNKQQRKAVRCFWYDAEMNSGGYSGYADFSDKAGFIELYPALREIGGKAIAANYFRARLFGRFDDWMETDDEFYGFSPSLSEQLQQYVETNKDKLFD